jgi:DNA polymerase-3 subunit gamma/tau
MPYLVLARKYRPTRFEDVIGQEAIAQTLKHAIETERVAHAYLFCGQRGVGKTTMARILASALNCEKGPTVTPCGACSSCAAIARGEDLDVLEIDGASNTGVDNIRDLRANARFAPARGRFKIYYVDEVHMLSKSAFNALLKTLEEPPPHVKFIFSTTEPHRIPETITSRCQRFDFRSIPPGAVAGQLGTILAAEGLAGDPGVLATLARRARGSLRDALSLLDQLVSATGGATDLDALERLLGLADRDQVEALGRAVVAHDAAAALLLVQRLLEDGRSLSEFLNLFIEYLREALLIAVCGRDTDLVTARDAARAAAADLAQALGAQGLLYAMQLGAETQRRLARAADERLPVEMALVKLCAAEPLVPLVGLVEQLERLDRGGGPRPFARPASAGAPPPAAREPRPSAPPPPRGPSPASFALDAPPADLAPPEGPAARPAGNRSAQWDATLQAVGETRRRIAGMLRSGAILALDDETLLLGFTPGQRTFIDQLSDPEMKAFIEGKMRAAFGRTIQLQFTVAAPGAAEPAPPAPAEETVRPAEREQAVNDPAVRSVTDLFGGRVVRTRRVARGPEPTPAEPEAE